jgi:hypothetical protein
MFRVIDATLDSGSDCDIPSNAPVVAAASSEPSAPLAGPSRQEGTPDNVPGSVADGSVADAAMPGGTTDAALQPSATPEVVVIDDDLRDEPLIGAPTARRYDPKEFWSRRIGHRFDDAVRGVSSYGGRIEWHLQPLRANIVEWCTGHIHDTLHEGYVAGFYIGVSHVICERWEHPRNSKLGHCRSGWQRMVICGVSDQSGEIGNAEKSVISRFRRFSRWGVHNANGNPLCTNRNPGGESSSHGVMPFFLYVCWKFNPRTNSLEGRR